MGAVIAVDFYLMRKFGLTDEYAIHSGSQFNVAVLLAWVFVPFYYQSKIFTMPEFLERRFGPRSSEILNRPVAPCCPIRDRPDGEYLLARGKLLK